MDADQDEDDSESETWSRWEQFIGLTMHFKNDLIYHVLQSKML